MAWSKTDADMRRRRPKTSRSVQTHFHRSIMSGVAPPQPDGFWILSLERVLPGSQRAVLTISLIRKDGAESVKIAGLFMLSERCSRVPE